MAIIRYNVQPNKIAFLFQESIPQTNVPLFWPAVNWLVDKL
jgi:hypothetical protein